MTADDFPAPEDLQAEPETRPIKRRIALVLLTGFVAACVVGVSLARPEIRNLIN